MKTLVMQKAFRSGIAAVIGLGQNVTVLLAPGGIVDFGNNDLDLVTGFVEAVIETDRVEPVAEIAQVGKESYRSLQCHAGFICNQPAHSCRQFDSLVAEMILAPEPGRGGASA